MNYSQPVAQAAVEDYDYSDFFKYTSCVILISSILLLWAICKHQFNPIDFFGLQGLVEYWWISIPSVLLLLNAIVYFGYVHKYAVGELLNQCLWAATTLFGVTIPSVMLWFVALVTVEYGIAASVLKHDALGTIALMMLTVMLPLNNIWTLYRVLKKDLSNPKLLGFVHGAAMASAMIYTLLFTPVIIKSLEIFKFGSHFDSIQLFFGLMFYFTSLIAPAGTLILAVMVSNLLWNSKDLDNWEVVSKTSTLSLIICTLVMLAPGVKPLIVSLESKNALSHGVKARDSLRLLKLFRCEDEVLRKCYWENEPRILILPAMVAACSKNSSFLKEPRYSDARILFYKLTGKSYSEYPRPTADSSLGWLRIFDPDQGGEVVGGKIKGLSLASSKFDCFVYKNELSSRYMWQIEFENNSKRAEEARCQILLPPRGVVSDMKLWIDGKLKAATFAERKKVRKAYRQVVAMQRDPALISSIGEDRILLQCFPVPKEGGKIKLMLQIAAPLDLESSHEAHIIMPKIEESNFAISKSHRAQIYKGEDLAVEQAILYNNESIDPKETSPASFDIKLNGTKINTIPDVVSNHGQSIRSAIAQIPNQSLTDIILVIDCSASMSNYVDQVEELIASIPDSIKTTVVFASEIPTHLFAEDNHSLANRFKHHHPAFEGGVENTPYLTKGITMAQTLPASSAVLWLHGPQPVSSKQVDMDDLINTIKNSDIAKYEISIVPGRNIIAERIDKSCNYSKAFKLLRKSYRQETLAHIVAESLLNPEKLSVRYSRDSQYMSSITAVQTNVSLTLAALWASSRVKRTLNEHDLNKAVQLAKQYRIVTPVTSAVVLQNAWQYRMAQLPEGRSPYVESAPISVSMYSPAVARLNSLSDAAACAGPGVGYSGNTTQYTYKTSSLKSSEQTREDEELSFKIALLLVVLTGLGTTVASLIKLTKLIKQKGDKDKIWLYCSLLVGGMILTAMSSTFAKLPVFLGIL